MPAKEFVASNLAAALLAGPWSAEEMVRRAARACGRRHRWLRALVGRVLAAFGAAPPATSLADFLTADAGFRQAWAWDCRHRHMPVRQVFWAQPVMAPAPGAPASWCLPALTTAGQLADWLGLRPAELDWFADCRGRLVLPGPLRHYTCRWLLARRKRARLLEIPKARLKAIQRRLLRELLHAIPTHDAAHGYRRGRSVVTHTAPHAGRRVVLHLDLRQFFPSVRASRVHALFRTAGYPHDVARLLTGLCTTATPADVLAGRPGAAAGDEDRALLGRHLPQGAPTSPALANLCAYRLDCRLGALGRTAGARYTRYADDLVFSGDEVFERCLRRFHLAVCRAALEEGFEVNTRKSHFMRQGVRQQVAGIVLNVRPNKPRAEFDQLKATLTNCVRHGPASQNREGRADFRAYLAGRVAYFAMINPHRGRRLRDLFGQVVWEDESPGQQPETLPT